MSRASRWTAEWPECHLRAYEPSPEEVAGFAPALAAFYNDAHNRAMMANTMAMTADEVREHYAELCSRGGRPFVLEVDGVLVGDADLRHVTLHSAELAILVGDRARQGQGLGRRFGLLLHGLAFSGLGLERLYASIIPSNLPSQRLFTWLGYRTDDSPDARAFADEPSDLTFSLARAEFQAAHGPALGAMRWSSGPRRGG
jgi:RimJ/RimL family protein N-acetyltransferase